MSAHPQLRGGGHMDPDTTSDFQVQKKKKNHFQREVLPDAG